MVVDDLLGDGTHDAVLRWHMLDAPYEVDPGKSAVRLATPVGDVFVTVVGHPAMPTGLEVFRGQDEPGRVRGFAAPYYGERLPIPTMEIQFRRPLPQRLITTFRPGAVAMAHLAAQSDGRERWELTGGASDWLIDLAAPGRSADKTFLAHERRVSGRAAGDGASC
jgi:hypothetical protein